jgi:hypothetical protein
MQRALSFLREAIEAFHRGESAAELLRMREPSSDYEPSSTGHALRLLSNEGSEALAEVRERGELPADEIEWLGRQRSAMRILLTRSRGERAARARLADIETPTGGTLVLGEELTRIALTADLRSRNETCRALETQLRPLAEARVTAQLKLEELAYVDIPREEPADKDNPKDNREKLAPASFLIVSAFDADVLSPARRDLAQHDWLKHAASFLDQTEAAAQDATRFVVRNVHARSSTGEVPWHTLFGALRAYDLDSEIGRKQRWLRTAGWLRHQGFEEAMSARLHAEVDENASLPLGRALAIDVPRDVRLAQSPRDFGVLSDVAAAEAVARGLSLALAHVGLPPELRYPLGACVPGVIGFWGALAWTDREQLTRVQHLSSTQADRIGRIGRSALLLWARACVSLALMPASEPGQPEVRLELLCGALGRGLCARIEPGIAGVLAPDRLRARALALEALCGLAGATALRERLNADWFRNPRAGDLLRSLAQRGNRLSAEAMCTELERTPADAAMRAIELVA